MSSFPIHWCTVSKINIKVLEKENNYDYKTRDIRTCESAVFPTCTLCHYILSYDNMHWDINSWVCQGSFVYSIQRTIASVQCMVTLIIRETDFGNKSRNSICPKIVFSVWTFTFNSYTMTSDHTYLGCTDVRYSLINPSHIPMLAFVWAEETVCYPLFAYAQSPWQMCTQWTGSLSLQNLPVDFQFLMLLLVMFLDDWLGTSRRLGWG